MREFERVRQHTGHFRRWFEDDYFDLIVWYDGREPSAEVTGFQLCYDKGRNERALTWRKGGGFSHSGIDDGEPQGSGSAKMTPVLVTDGVMPLEQVQAEFERRSAELDATVRTLVLDGLEAYARETNG